MSEPLETLQPETRGGKEPLKKLLAGLVVWLLAALVVWWSQDAHSSRDSRSMGTVLDWLGALIGMGLYCGGGLLVFRPLTAWGFFQPWLVRCGTVERLAIVAAAVLTLLTIIAHWFASYIDAWMLAAVVGLLVLASAFGWKMPWQKRSKEKS